MNKELLISIKPEHLVNILNGKKTLELRKTVPKDYKGWVNIYCTKSSGGRTDMKRPYLFKSSHDNEFLKDCGADIYLLSNLKPIRNILNGKVVARFWFDEYEKYENTDLYSYTYRHRIDKLFNQACITADELYKYIKKVKPEEETTYRKYYPFYAWHIKQLEIFDKPKELSEFYKTSIEIEEIEYAIENYSQHAITKLYKYVITRPPQSYQFVYVKE